MGNKNEPAVTRQDFYDWLRANGIEQTALPEYKANVLMLKNPKTNAKTWINLPIDETIIRGYDVQTICRKLGIPVPDWFEYSDYMYNRVKKDHFK